MRKKCAKKVIMPGCIDLNIQKVVIFGDPGKSGKCPNFINLGHTSRGSSHQKIFTCGIWFFMLIDPDLWGGVLVSFHVRAAKILKWAAK